MVQYTDGDDENEGAMPEHHDIVGPARGEPLPAGRVGIRLRIGLSGSPSTRWSRDLSARLTRETTGHPAVGHLRLNDLVQGQEIVLDGVEPAEAPAIFDAIERAVASTNAATARDPAPGPQANMSPADADAIADAVKPPRQA